VTHTLVLRTAEARDVAPIAALGLKVWLATYTARGLTNEIARYVLDKFSIHSTTQMLEQPSHYAAVIELDGRLVAYALLKTQEPCPADEQTTAELSTLYVQQPNVGQGLGSRLLAACTAELRVRGQAEDVWLRVNSKNSPALQFYERHNFRKVGSVWVEFDGERNENYVLVRGRSTESDLPLRS
jgi:diamine N-acetyltransferase